MTLREEIAEIHEALGKWYSMERNYTKPKAINPEEATDQILSAVRRHHEDKWLCQGCGRKDNRSDDRLDYCFDCGAA